MALSSREILLILRARDEATRTIGRVSAAMSTMDRNAATSSSRMIDQQKATLRGLQSQLGDVNTQYSRTLNEAYAMHRQQQNATNQALANVRNQVRGVNDQYREQSRLLQDARRAGRIDATDYSNRLQDANRLRQDQLRILASERTAIQDTSRVSHAAYNQQVSDARALHITQQEQIRMQKEQANETLRQHQRIMKANSIERQNLVARGQALVGYGASAIAAGTAMMYFGTRGAMAFASVTSAAIDYEQAARKTLTQTDTVEASLRDIKNMGMEIADTVPVAFEEIQPALYDVFSSIDVGLRGARKLTKQFAKDTVAGQTDMQTATRANLQIMNAFKVETKDAAKVSDFMFQLVRKGVGSYDEFAKSIGRAIPSARRAGQTYETLGAMMAFMTRNGLSTAMAATSAARALDAVSHPKTVARLEEMGIATKNMKGEFRELPDILNDMDKKFGKMTSPERSKALQELFLGAGGTIQARRFFDNYFKNSDEFNQRTKEMARSAGAAEQAFNTMAESPQAKIQQLKNDFMLLKIEMGENLMPIAMRLVGWANDLVDWFKNLSPETQRLIGIIAGLTLAVTIIGGALTALVGVGMVWVGAINMMGTSAAVTAGKLGLLGGGLALLTGGYAATTKSTSDTNKAMGILASTAGGALMGSALGPLGAVLGGTAGAMFGLYNATKNTGEGMENAKQPVLNFIATLDQLTGATTRATREMALQKLNQDDLLGSAASIGISARTMVDAALGQKDAIKQVNDAYKGQKDIVGLLQGSKLEDWIRRTTGELASSKAAWERTNFAAASYKELLQKLPKAVRMEIKQAGAEPSSKQIRNLMADADKLTGKQRRIVIELLGGPAVVTEALKIEKALKKATETRPNMDPLMAAIAAGVGDASQTADTGSKKIRRSLKEAVEVKPNFNTFNGGMTAGSQAAMDLAMAGGIGVGNSLQQGVINGFADTQAQLSAEAAAAVRAAVRAARAAAKAKSPSREMYDLGVDMGNGLLLGWNARAGEVEKGPSKTVKRMANELLREMDTQIPKMSNVLDQARELIEKKLDKQRAAIDKRLKDADKALDRFDKNRDRKEKSLLAGVAEATEKDLKKLSVVVTKYQRKLKDLEAAKDKLQQMQDQKTAYISSLSSSLASIGNMADIKGQEIVETSTDFFGNVTTKNTGTYKPVTINDIVSGMGAKLAKIREFGGMISQLRGMGYSAALINQVLQMGPEQGFDYAKALVTATSEQVSTINAMDAGITTSASSLATEGGAHMYDVGIALQAGLVAGLQADVDRLKARARMLGIRIEEGLFEALNGKDLPGDKQGRAVGNGIAAGLYDKVDKVGAGGRALARSIIRNFNDELKIASPSKVGIAGGRNYGSSVAMGMMREVRTIDKASRYLAYATQFEPKDVTGTRFNSAPVVGASERPSVHQEINVTTQELDPVRHAAMLGWELANRGL